jgi:PAS domain S-box-containing protein
MPHELERYAAVVKDAFGDGAERIEEVAHRAKALFGATPVIVWEGDAQTFHFSFVSDGAEEILGHPADRWTTEPTFWTDAVVHPEDRDDAVAYCALATGKGRDHAFEYRAKRLDGSTVHLVDYVQVVKGARGVAERLRGIMIDVTASRGAGAGEARWEAPPRAALEVAAQ